MRENKVTNILFIVFTVMALAGTASLVKTAIAPKENMQETEQKVIPEKPTGEPVPAQAGNDKKIDTADKKKQQPSDKQGKNDPDAAVQKKPEGKNPADSNGQGEPVNEPENPDQGTPGDETAAPDGQETNNDESADNVTDDGNSEDSQVTEESDESGVDDAGAAESDSGEEENSEETTSDGYA